jgi:hypothetical protein
VRRPFSFLIVTLLMMGSRLFAQEETPQVYSLVVKGVV